MLSTYFDIKYTELSVLVPGEISQANGENEKTSKRKSKNIACSCRWMYKGNISKEKRKENITDI